MTSTAKFAEAYTRRYGLKIVPLPPRTKRPLADDWGNNLLETPADAEAYYTNHPDWNIGIALGPSRLCSLDVDDIESMRLICDEFGLDLNHLHATHPTIQGAAKGFRIMFRVPEGVDLPYHSLTWPKREGGGRFTVFELRAACDGQQRQDVFPPSIHPDTGKPYVWMTRPNGHFPDPPDWLLTIWREWDKFKPQLQDACPWAERREPPAPARPAAPRDGESVIDAYVASRSITDALTAYGYQKKGKRYLSPHSGTGLPGVNIFPDGRAWIHHGSDPLCSDESGRPVNVFDLFCYYEHGGDMKKAVKAAADALGIKPQRRKPATAPAPIANVDLETGEILPESATDHAPSNDRPVIHNSMPMETAKLFHDTLPEGGRIIFWRGEFYSWVGSHYVARDRVYIEQRLYRFMSSCDTIKKTNLGSEVVSYHPKATNINDVVHALRAVCYADLPEGQAWIESRPGDVPAHEIIAFKNGFLHYPSRTLLKATDRLFVLNALEFDFNPNAPAPVEWKSFLASIWPDDPNSISSLAEMFGYLLTGDTSQQKMFMFIGPTRSGKGTILRVLEALVGQHNRVSPSLASIGTQFGLQPLIGKRLAMISDARLSGRADQQPIVENLLRISGEDALTIDRKNIAAWSGKLPTRFVFASNELPAFSDASAALANRFLLFKFSISFIGREDPGLTSRLLRELPGIVLWALDGLMDFQERGYLVRPASSDDITTDLIEQTSPIRTFVDECCSIGDTLQCERDELFKAWRIWCEEQGRDHPGTKVSFGRQLSAAFPAIKRSQPRESGTRLNLCQGIKLCQEWSMKIIRN